jgi:uncharacterized membrane protein YfcA
MPTLRRRPAAAPLIHLAKVAVYGRGMVVSARAVPTGLILGPGLLLGTYLGRCVVTRLSETLVLAVVDITLAAAGLRLALAG